MYYDKVIRSLLLSMAILAILALGCWAVVQSGHVVDAQVTYEFNEFLKGATECES